MRGKIALIVLFMMAFTFLLKAQERPISMDENYLVVTVDLKKSNGYIDSLLLAADIRSISALQLRNKQIGELLKSGWKYSQVDERYVKLVYPLAQLTEQQGFSLQAIVDIIFKWNKGDPGYDTKAAYGLNRFSTPTVKDISEDQTSFSLNGFTSARKVYLAGEFNAWNPVGTPMQKTAGGWTVTVPLKAGKHLYKFIADDNWMEDPANLQKQDDGYYGYNSVYFKYNYTFTLKGYSNRKQVILAGTFNNWNEQELKMQKTATGWALPMYLEDGRHEYKFIADGEWLHDPANPNTLINEHNTLNSVLYTGRAVNFAFVAANNASKVSVAGSFNQWNPDQFFLKKTDGVWKTELKLPEGNHQYKFVANGQWYTDPSNPHKTGEGDFINSICVVMPNYTFRLKGYPQAKEVRISGNFNAETTNGYTLEKRNGEWMISLWLPPGKVLYRFNVDGKWMRDPFNKLYEESSPGLVNSILWIGEKSN